MRILRDGRAVRGPACVRDAGRAFEMGFVDLRVEIGDARDAARAARCVGFEHGDAARIVATVFEAPQSFDQHRNDITLRNCADNAAHEWSIL